ncbi:CDP-glycerol glycerophosphotransferase family protein [Merdibacter massiliensis]|uniref:CDP-glycerol glycerophosphotransferase family protein n=1 Tax=Merdibacter massiliensis TaxID=1871030 RepID=UPI00096AC734|nr:CDP-glycerol glycerophosphotransferase family protein [Merdibacter massiliensis]
MGKKVSIIVPVYNGEDFFEKSLHSLLSQTILQDLEIIIINDGSSDDTQKIIDEYQILYPDIIKSKTVENGGAGKARNYALDLAEGEYIGFVDSDDFISNTMYEKLYRAAIDTASDIVVCGYYVATNRTLRAYQKGYMDNYGKSVYDDPDIFVNGVPYLWNKIFKRDLIEINHIRFKNFRIFEDLEFTYKLFFLANRISKVDEPLYYYMKWNSLSLTAKFSERFFDIIPAIDSLIQFTKEINVYDQFKDYLLFIYLNHMYIRMNANVSLSDLKLKFKYIDACFQYLDMKFPNWKEHNYYYENKKRNKKRYISKTYWKVMSLLLKVITKVNKLMRKLKKFFKTLFKKKSGAKYLHYAKKKPIDACSILLDSQHGEDLDGNMFYLLKELQKPIYNKYRVYVSVSAKRIEEFEKKIKFYNIEHVALLKVNSNKYLRTLATAKYLFNDTSFPVYFTKREGQIYFNTWHGTPLKTLGKKTKEDFYNIGNLQKNFNAADYLLYPSVYMMNHMVEDYMLANISHNQIALTGYPRNSIFFNDDRRRQIKEQLGLSNYQIIAYMPTWRGTLNNQDNDEYVIDLQAKLRLISRKLLANQLFYINVHPYLKDFVQIDGLENIKMFPKEFETYDFLNIADILITDYSSVFFDFACTSRPIILFAYDKEAYMRERGLYINFNALPFPMVETVDDLIEAINSKNDVQYDSFIEEYAKYDSANVCEKICNQIILGKNMDIELVNMPNNGNKNILSVVNDLSSYFLNEKFFSLTQRSDTKRYNYYLTYINANVYKHKYELLRLPSGYEYYGQLFKFASTTMGERVLLSVLLRFKFVYALFKRKINSIFTDECKRIFNDITFDVTLLIGEKKFFRLLLFTQMKGKKILYFPSGQEFNDKISTVIYQRFDKIFVEDKQSYEHLIEKYPACHFQLIKDVTSLDQLLEN